MVDNEEINLTKKKKKKTANLNDLLDADSAQDTKEPVPEGELDMEEELDLKLKKKKKKKKTGFTLDGEEGNKENGDMSAAASADVPDEELDLPVKKKSSKTLTEDVDELTDDIEEALQLKSKKKKKKKPLLPDEKQVTFQEPDEEVPADDSHLPVGEQKWSGSDRDYHYEELLTRVFDIMRLKNPEMVAGEKKRFIMKPPQCARVGTKKTSFVNFNEVCLIGSVDGNSQLIIKGRFQQKQLESVLRRYIKEYVTCHTCKNPDTLLERDVRLYFLRCRVCLSRCSVAAIKSGFQAVTNKRARIRAKAGP